MHQYERLARAERMLPRFLASLDGWTSLDVNYQPPRVERLWRQMGDERMFIHRLHPCAEHEVLFHPHGWPSEMLVIDGTYRMLVGSGEGVQPPVVVLDLEFEATPQWPLRYKMDHPNGWHAVIPVGGPVYTLMVTGMPWQREIPVVSREASGILSPLSQEAQVDLLKAFAARWIQRPR